MSWTIFYAWQSDRPNNTNRGLIHKALEEAIKEVRADGSLAEDPRLDKDTMGIAGAPDIEATIFSKIEQAAVFVADVTNVTDDAAGRPTPNPNVLIELGYALRALGPERIVMVMNTAHGTPDSLPFDIRRRRALTYKITPEMSEKAPERRVLQQQLREAIKASLEASDPPQPPPAPSVAQQFIGALRGGTPEVRMLGRRYSADFLARLDAKNPRAGIDDEALVRGLSEAVPLVTEFSEVAEIVAAYDAESAVEEFLRIFEDIVSRYDQRSGFVGSFRNTDFDYYKFLGHELYVGFIAALIREEKWQQIDGVLRAQLHVRNTVREEKTVSFDDISAYTALLDEVRRDRLQKPGEGRRISVRADILKDRYSSPPLSTKVSWEEFCAADYFLYLRSKVQGNGSAWRSWIPWSVLYLKEVPSFVQRSVSKDYAARVSVGLGLEGSLEGLGTRLKAETERLKDFYRGSFWRSPGEYFDWSKIASQ